MRRALGPSGVHRGALFTLLFWWLSACGHKQGNPGTPCEPRTCQSAGATCGQIDDGCGVSVECGGCAAPESCGGGGVANVCGSGLPPDPAAVAPPVSPATPTDLADSVEFLYTGDRPIQIGVKPGTIDKSRVAVLRGQPLPVYVENFIGFPVGVFAEHHNWAQIPVTDRDRERSRS